MGEPKALLSIDGETFVERSIRILRDAGITEIIVVANSDTNEAIRGKIGTTKCVINPRPEDGMVSSIIAALEVVRSPKLLVTLVDIPEIDVSIVRQLIEEDAADAFIVLPRYDDGQGHPLLLLESVYPYLSIDLPKGLKTIIERHSDRVKEVRISGRQPWDFDTPADYGRLAR